MVIPWRVQRFTSRRVSARVRGDGGYSRWMLPPRVCAVGSPSVIRMTWRLAPRCRSKRRAAACRAAWMLVKAAGTPGAPWASAASNPRVDESQRVPAHAALQVRKETQRLGRQAGQIRQRQLLGVGGEADDVQPVARELRADQGVESQGHALGGGETAAARHGAAHVQQQHGGAARRRFGVVNLEILRLQAQRGAPAASPCGVQDRAPQVQGKGVAKPEGAAVLLPLAAHAAPAHGVAAEGVAPQRGKDAGHGALGDPAGASRRELKTKIASHRVRSKIVGKVFKYPHLTKCPISQYLINQAIVDGVCFAAPEDAIQHPV